MQNLFIAIAAIIAGAQDPLVSPGAGVWEFKASEDIGLPAFDSGLV